MHLLSETAEMTMKQAIACTVCLQTREILFGLVYSQERLREIGTLEIAEDQGPTTNMLIFLATNLNSWDFDTYDEITWHWRNSDFDRIQYNNEIDITVIIDGYVLRKFTLTISGREVASFTLTADCLDMRSGNPKSVPRAPSGNGRKRPQKDYRHLIGPLDNELKKELDLM